MKRESPYYNTVFKVHPRTMQQAFGPYATCNFEQPKPRYVDKIVAVVCALGFCVALACGLLL